MLIGKLEDEVHCVRDPNKEFDAVSLVLGQREDLEHVVHLLFLALLEENIEFVDYHVNLQVLKELKNR